MAVCILSLIVHCSAVLHSRVSCVLFLAIHIISSVLSSLSAAQCDAPLVLLGPNLVSMRHTQTLMSWHYDIIVISPTNFIIITILLEKHHNVLTLLHNRHYSCTITTSSTFCHFYNIICFGLMKKHGFKVKSSKNSFQPHNLGFDCET